MSLAHASLPSDPEQLRAFAANLQAALGDAERKVQVVEVVLDVCVRKGHAEREGHQAEIRAKALHIEKLKMQLALLRRARFGRSSEKLDGEIEQLELMIDELEEGQAESLARTHALEARTVPEKRERSVPVRKKLPEHLPRERVEHEAACACPNCGGTRLTHIGADEREVLEYVPGHFKAVVHVRPKMSCRDCEAITQAPMPSLPVERGLAGPGLLAHVVVSKYCDHLPLYRQSGIYARDGVDIERSTMADWVGQTAFLLDPLAQSIAEHVRGGEAIHADDTPVPVLDPGRKRAKTGRLWVAVRDERPWGSRAPPAAFYRYAPDRKALQADALLKGCQGFLHADAYAGYRKLYAVNRITGQAQLTEVACWAHARRQIYDVHHKTASPAAYRLLEAIGALFAIEESIKGCTPEERLAVRQKLAVPLLDELKALCGKTLSQISRKSGLAKAIRYALTRWTALTRYTTDGRLDISNNAAERAIRPLALGRKNWLFAGSDSGGVRAATMYTIIETVKLNGLDPEAYLRAVIARIADHPMKRLSDLLPWNIDI